MRHQRGGVGIALGVDDVPCAAPGGPPLRRRGPAGWPGRPAPRCATASRAGSPPRAPSRPPPRSRRRRRARRPSASAVRRGGAGRRSASPHRGTASPPAPRRPRRPARAPVAQPRLQVRDPASGVAATRWPRRRTGSATTSAARRCASATACTPIRSITATWVVESRRRGSNGVAATSRPAVVAESSAGSGSARRRQCGGVGERGVPHRGSPAPRRALDRRRCSRANRSRVCRPKVTRCGQHRVGLRPHGVGHLVEQGEYVARISRGVSGERADHRRVQGPAARRRRARRRRAPTVRSATVARRRDQPGRDDAVRHREHDEHGQFPLMPHQRRNGLDVTRYRRVRHRR